MSVPHTAYKVLYCPSIELFIQSKGKSKEVADIHNR